MDSAQLRDGVPGARPAGRLPGRVALVIGAASGIGAGIAEGFVREGADLALVDLAPEEAAADVRCPSAR